MSIGLYSPFDAMPVIVIKSFNRLQAMLVDLSSKSVSDKTVHHTECSQTSENNERFGIFSAIAYGKYEVDGIADEEDSKNSPDDGFRMIPEASSDGPMHLFQGMTRVGKGCLVFRSVRWWTVHGHHLNFRFGCHGCNGCLQFQNEKSA